MNRRQFNVSIVSVAVAWPLATQAQQPAMPVIGSLSSGSPESDAFRLAGLRRGLKEAGYIEGGNVTIEYRRAGNQLDRLPVLAVDLVRRPVGVILACGLSAALAAQVGTQILLQVLKSLTGTSRQRTDGSFRITAVVGRCPSAPHQPSYTLADIEGSWLEPVEHCSLDVRI
jgi:putative ABC transport system substrate-binding protein